MNHKKLIPAEILNLKIGDNILINFYNEKKIIHSKCGRVEVIDFNKLYDDVESFIKIKNNKGELENILYENYNYDIYFF